jgi:hypothetical protein
LSDAWIHDEDLTGARTNVPLVWTARSLAGVLCGEDEILGYFD